MHSQAAVAEVLALREAGLGARRIAKRTNLPVRTVTDWIAGRLPRHSRALDLSKPQPPACRRCGHQEHRFHELPQEYVYLLGLYLGDGCIATHPRGVYRLRIMLDSKYPGIVNAAACAMGDIRRGKVSVQRFAHQNCVEVHSYWKSWPCLLPQHGPGKKHERSIALAEWQTNLVERWPNQLLRGLIQSDGCRFLNTGRAGWVCPRYGFSQVSDDIRGIFCQACDLMGLHWTASGKRTIYVSRKADVAKLDEFIGPKC